MEVTEWDVSFHSAVQKEIREEAIALKSVGGEGGHHQGRQRLLAPPGDVDLLLISGMGDIGGGRLLAGGGQELVPGEVSVEEDYQNTQKVGVRAGGIQILLLSHGTVSVALWLRDLGGHSPHGKVTRGVLGPGCEADDRAYTVVETLL